LYLAILVPDIPSPARPWAPGIIEPHRSFRRSTVAGTGQRARESQQTPYRLRTQYWPQHRCALLLFDEAFACSVCRATLSPHIADCATTRSAQRVIKTLR
jgi:hypothetical protein